MPRNISNDLYILSVNIRVSTICSELQKKAYEVLSESSRTLNVVTASVKDEERAGQGHISASLLHQYAT
jgi:hypothetical protein